MHSGIAGSSRSASRNPTDRTGANARRSRVRRPKLLLRRLLVATACLAAVLVGISVIGALRTPGNEDFKAKWADWLRSHHSSVFVNHLESFYYSHSVPKRGGQPTALNSVPSARPGGGGSSAAGPVHLRPPAPVPLVVAPALPGEGTWVPAGPLVKGTPGMYVAQFRADQVYTSQITSAVWIDTSILRLSLIPGATEPGGAWAAPPNISGAALAGAVAAFNGGFRFQDAHGGFYLDGREAVPLRTGAASLVIH